MDNGNEDPTVTVYWGESDGETTSGNWENGWTSSSDRRMCLSIAAFAPI